MLFYTLFIIVILQRSAELVLAKRNEKILRRKGAVEYDHRGYTVIVIMHIVFLASFLSEYLLLSRKLNTLWFLFLMVFLSAQALRYWAIFSLGTRWNTKVLILPGTELVTRGPYKYMKHPNYLAVAAEIVFLPLIFSCYYTSVIFGALNFLALRRRIGVEERALGIGKPDREPAGGQ